MHWVCARACGSGGSRQFPSAALASRYAEVFETGRREKQGTAVPLHALGWARHRLRRRG
jgi:hypothetical protein